MEQLLHYCWKHKLLPLRAMQTTDGRRVEVLDTGLHNHDAGPDFFNAKVKVDGTLWVGNVELHEKSSDWYLHGHDKDAAYDNVVLHVARQVDRDVLTRSGRQLPQMEIQVPEDVALHYQELLHYDQYPPCHAIIPDLSPLMIHSWLSALTTERLEQKTEAIEQRVARLSGDWEAAFFVTIARNYGFGINGDAFEAWAMALPLQSVAHHRDDLFQVEALFLGQAGLLDLDAMPASRQEAAAGDPYFVRLRNEYGYLQHKFSLQPIEATRWRFLRLRPQNFPYIRIAQLARLYHERRSSLSRLMECKTVKQAGQLLNSAATPYWENHYTFGHESKPSKKQLSTASQRLLVLNTAVPMLFAYGRHRSDEQLCDRALQFLEQLPAEVNHITRTWRDCQLAVETAADSQALIQLRQNYCDRKDCLRCRFGYEYLKNNGNGR